MLGLLPVPTTMVPVVRHIPSWRRHQVSICHLAKFDLRAKTQSGDPGQAMVASFDVTIFLEALLGRSFAPPHHANNPAIPLSIDFAQVLTCKLCLLCPSIAILHDPCLPCLIKCQ
jgi:hypothetical protein